MEVKYKGNYVCLLAYFEIPENLEAISPHVAALWKRYLEGDEKFRNDRLKMIARCPQYPNAVLPCIRLQQGRVSLTTGSVGDQEAGGQRADDHRSQAAADDLPR